MLALQLLLGCAIALLAAVDALPSYPAFAEGTKPYKERRLLSSITGSDNSSMKYNGWGNGTDPSNSDISCFAQFPRPPFINPVLTTDCFAAVTHVIGDLSSLIPELWSTRRGRHRLPVRWTFQSCMIGLGTGRPGAEDFFPMALVAQTAATIIKTCLEDSGQRLGGKAKVGPGQWMDLLVANPQMPGAIDSDNYSR